MKEPGTGRASFLPHLEPASGSHSLPYIPAPTSTRQRRSSSSNRGPRLDECGPSAPKRATSGKRVHWADQWDDHDNKRESQSEHHRDQQGQPHLHRTRTLAPYDTPRQISGTTASSQLHPYADHRPQQVPTESQACSYERVRPHSFPPQKRKPVPHYLVSAPVIERHLPSSRHSQEHYSSWRDSKVLDGTGKPL